MRFSLNIDLDNAAFEDDVAPELRAILSRVSDRIPEGPVDGVFGGNLIDSNGNSVGSWRIA